MILVIVFKFMIMVIKVSFMIIEEVNYDNIDGG